MKKLFILLVILPVMAFAQSPISGIVNTYARVRNLGSNYIVSDSAAFFVAGNMALLIQMKGGIMDTTNTLAFGSVTNYQSAGNYEFLTVDHITGNSVYFTTTIGNSYDTVQPVQLIKVPKLNNALVTDTLKSREWDGQTGGVLALFVRHKLTLNSWIQASGCGYRGGTIDNNPNGSCGAGYTNQAYPLAIGFGGEKGEGIVPIYINKETGLGPQSNGGGGGNKHNSGGGGGGNYTAGGGGGNQASFCPSTPVGGRGGRKVDYMDIGPKIFMGGGGGCSDYNNAYGTFGTDGGGIVIIIADTIQGNGNHIESNGLDQTYIINPIGDGAGGGGAGGTVYLKTKNYGTTPLNVSMNGGHGGDQNTSYSSCFGIGGGGGAGLFLLDTLYIPSNLHFTTTAGTPGIDLSSSSPCYMGSYGATGGDTGTGLIIVHTVVPPLVTPSNPVPAAEISVAATSNQLTIYCDQNYTHGKYVIIDMLGRQVYSKDGLMLKNDVDISAYPAGVYNILFSIDGMKYYRRFVKM